MARILMIGDCLVASDMFARLLRLEGHDVVTAQSGLEAVDLAASQPSDLLICDLNLPDISGVEVISQLRGRGVHVPVVIVTHFPDIDSSFSAGAAGALAYVSGILVAEELTAIVRNVPSGRVDVGLSPGVENGFPSAMSSTLRRALKLIDVDPAVPAKQLAVLSGISESCLRHQFKTVLGVTLGRFLGVKRLQLAARLLETDEPSIRSIAQRVGISDIRHFRKIFRVRFGMTPHCYRTQVVHPSRIAS